MHRKFVVAAGCALVAAALACGPASTPIIPGPTMDSIPRPTDTSAPAPASVEPTAIPPAATLAPTSGGSGAGGTPITTTGDNTLAGFQQALLDNISSRNYSFLLYTMNDPFTISAWRAGGGSLTPNEAVDKLRTDLLPPQNVVHYYLDRDITALLDGTPPDQMFGPDVKIVSAVFMDGWGTDGKAEAIIFISQSPDGIYAWYGLIFAGQGFK
jgi:hypothetical protein